MGHNGTEDTGEVPRGESDSQLGSLAVLVFGSCEDILIEFFNDILESHEFNHSVRHLSAPERH